MIRQLCPHCQKLVELPDSAAGAIADCPQCGKPVVVPAAYSPNVAAGGGLAGLPPVPVVPPPPPPEPVAAPTPPPGLRPEVLNPPPAFDAGAVPPTVGIPSGYNRVASLTFAPGWLAWVPVGGVTFALVLTLFTWASTYAGGVGEYSQNPWWALFGDMTTNPVRGDATKLEEPEINKLLSGSRWLIIYLPLLLVGTGLLWVERVVKNPTVATMPGPLAWVPGVWPRRFALLALLTGVLLLALTLQGLRGFGLENALRARVVANHAAALEAAEASNSTVERQKAEVAINEEFAKYHYQTTLAFKLAVVVHVLAFAAMLARWWLHRRGAKPYPRLLFQW